MSTFVMKHSVDSESFTVYLNDIPIVFASHDDIGWSGMESIELVISNISNVLNIPIYVTEEQQ